MREQISSTPMYGSDTLISKFGICERIEKYLDLIMEENQKFNLVSRETSREKLFQIAADSLVPFEFLSCPEGEIFDIGSGAGFPLAVILMAFPNVKGVFIERNQKKADFLKGIIDTFSLKAEIMPFDFNEARRLLDENHFSLGFMKLVKLDNRLLKNAAALLKPGGNFVCFSDIDEKNVDMREDVFLAKYRYYLDDPKQLRTLSIFAKKS